MAKSVMSPTCQTADYLCDKSKNSSRFWKENAEKVCEDEEDISGKIVIVTGSNAGIGKMIALQMAKRGAVLIMAVRNLDKGQEALEDIKKSLKESSSSSDPQIELMRIDTGDLQSIRDFVKAFQSKYDKLHILINNAGVMVTSGKLSKTKDGFEQHIGVNHLGPFLLTRLLVDSLKAGAPSRVICVSSSLMASARLDLDDLMMEKKVKTGNSGKEPYNISKLCSTICMRKFAQGLEKDCGVKIYQMCPGYVKSDLHLTSDSGFFEKLESKASQAMVGITPHQGSQTAVFCAVAMSVVEGENSGKGEFYRFAKFWEKGNQILEEWCATEDSDKLYKLSETLVGL